MFMDVKDLSEYLHIKRSTLYAWVEQHRIPFFKIHGLIRFQREDIERWVDSCQVAAEPTLKGSAPARGLGADVDTLIARAKGQAYNPGPRGNQTEIKPHRKGGA